VQEAQRTHNHTRVVTNQAYFDDRLSLYQLELATGSRCLEPLRTRKLLTSEGCDARDRCHLGSDAIRNGHRCPVGP
jgi:hypothetical protein